MVAIQVGQEIVEVVDHKRGEMAVMEAFVRPPKLLVEVLIQVDVATNPIALTVRHGLPAEPSADKVNAPVILLEPLTLKTADEVDVPLTPTLPLDTLIPSTRLPAPLVVDKVK